MKSILCIDVGNTTTHFILLQNSHSLFSSKIPTKQLDFTTTPLTQLIPYPFTQVAYASVVPSINPIIEAACKEIKTPCYHLSHKNCPFKINYPAPEEVGEDRLAAILGAQKIAQTPLAIIDLGTALTLDFLSPDNTYTPGAIAPGLTFFTDYLHQQTALLPLLSIEDLNTLPNSITRTEDAMIIGCLIGMAGMIDNLLTHAELTQRCPFKTILATGGGFSLIAPYIKHFISYDPLLIHKGLESAFFSSTDHQSA